MTLRWNCKTDGCYRDQLPDWSMLKGCFDPVNADMVSDWDGIVHQRGRFLFLEKKFPHAVLAQPSIRCINSAVEQGNTAIAFWCKESNGSDVSGMRVWGLDGFDSQKVMPATLSDLRAAVRQWWNTVYREGEM